MINIQKLKHEFIFRYYINLFKINQIEIYCFVTNYFYMIQRGEDLSILHILYVYLMFFGVLHILRYLPYGVFSF